MPSTDQHIERQIAALQISVTKIQSVTEMLPAYMNKMVDLGEKTCVHDAKIDQLEKVTSRIDNSLANIYNKLDAQGKLTATIGAKQWATIAAISFIFSLLMATVTQAQ